MAKIFGVNTRISGKVGQMLYRQTKTGTVVSELPVKPSTPLRTARQMSVRAQWSNLGAIYRQFDSMLRRGFENLPAGMNVYNAFIQANLGVVKVYITKTMRLNGGAILAPYQITRGDVARNAFQDAGVGRRRFEFAVFNDKNVVSGAFRDVALMIEHQRFFATGVIRFDLRHNVVEVVQRLDARVDRVGRRADRAGGNDFNPLVVEVGRVKGKFLNDNNDRRVFAEVRVEAERPFAAGNDQANISVGETVRFERLIHRGAHFFLRNGNLNIERFRGIPKAVDMLFQTENFAVITTQPFKNTVAEQKSVIENADFRVFAVDQTTVNINFKGHENAFRKYRRASRRSVERAAAPRRRFPPFRRSDYSVSAVRAEYPGFLKPSQRRAAPPQERRRSLNTT